MTGKKYVPMHMHLHASHEPTASIGGHMARAASLGIRHLWLTEHDTRMGPKEKAISRFTFQAPALKQSTERMWAGFEQTGDGEVSFFPWKSGYAMTFTVRDGDCGELLFASSGKRHCDPLFARPTVEMEAVFSVSDSDHAGAEVDFTLSQQPPSFQRAHLVYRQGRLGAEESDTMAALPLPAPRGGAYRFALWQDVPERIGGLDNALCNLTLRLRSAPGGCASVTLYALGFASELAFEQVRQEQIKLAASLGARYGVTPYVTFEITGAGNHKNCYGTQVPVMDYRASGWHISQAEAIAHVIAHGGIWCLNHPLNEKKQRDLTAQAQQEMTEARAQELIRHRLWGATLMEVGFPSGKQFTDAPHFLTLWDRLSSAGIPVTGDGDSDNHANGEQNWLWGNNFASYAGVEGAVTEEALVAAMVRGDLYMGDPVTLGALSFTAGEAHMGAFVVGEAAEMTFRASNMRCAGTVRRIVNGHAEAEIPLREGNAQDVFTLCATEKYNFARMEIYDEQGRLTALTNPIYLVRTQADLPPEAKRRQIVIKEKYQ